MRILRVTSWIYPDTNGGGDYHVHAMSRDQVAIGHDVTVLTTRVDESLPRVEEAKGYPYCGSISESSCLATTSRRQWRDTSVTPIRTTST